ncbi:MsnO8 family LLM class oxidoreductase [Streptomyces sp. NPDC091219]|uniref:MsnO8 family LLM class oxidoreductase n=1 Tax=Streptomyces sp. NPDC091219 TaxID=3155193 RepID=UPI00344C1A1B
MSTAQRRLDTDDTGPAVRLSVLDVGATDGRVPPARAVQEIAELAQVAEECGFHRFWVAEHHGSPDLVSSAPPVLMAHIAARTRRIRVGSGGVMLPNHAPYVVAEQFATLGALHPGRIDLGLGRSSNTAGTPAYRAALESALRRDARAMVEFPALIDELTEFLDPSDAPSRLPDNPALRLSPRVEAPAEVHVLGAGEGSARTAAERSLPFVYGHHLGRSKCRPAAVERYRAAFVPGPHDARPHLIASLNVLCAGSDDEAERLALHAARVSVRQRTGSAAQASPPSAREDFLARRFLEDQQVVYGGRDTVAEAVGHLADALGADEIMVVPVDPTGAERRRTLRTLTGRQGPVSTHLAVAGAGRPAHS